MKPTTIELTSKHLKFHKLLSWVFILLGLISIVSGSGEARDESIIAWGCLSGILGFVWLVVTRIRIWWNHS